MSLEKKNYLKPIFYLSMTVLSVSFFVLLIMTNGEAAKSFLYQGRNQTFMDFYNSMLYNVMNPYESHVFYPPLAMLMYKVLLKIVYPSTVDSIVISEYANSFSVDVKLRQEFLLPLILYSLAVTVGFYFAIMHTKKGSRPERFAFTAIAFTTVPMLFMFDRGNNVIVALIFSLVFIANYRSEDNLTREIGLISLAIAIAIKIYPVVFCLLLVNRKKITHIIRVIIYTSLLFIVPLVLFYGGIDSISLIVKNLSSYSGRIAMNIGSQLNFEKMLVFPLMNTTLSNETLHSLGNCFKLIVVFFAAVGALFAKEHWQRTALCCAIIYGYPGTCATYNLIFFIIPIILLLDEGAESIGSLPTWRKVFTYASLAMFVLSQGLLVVINPVTGQASMLIYTKITSYATLVLTIQLSIEGVIDCEKTISEFLEIKFSTAQIIAGITSMVLFALVIIMYFTGLIGKTLNDLLIVIPFLAAALYIILMKKYKEGKTNECPAEM